MCRAILVSIAFYISLAVGLYFAPVFTLITLTSSALLLVGMLVHYLHTWPTHHGEGDVWWRMVIRERE